MEINKTTTITLSVKEVKQIIKKHLKKENNMDVEKIYFNVGGHEDPADSFAQLPLTYKLDNVICEVITKE